MRRRAGLDIVFILGILTNFALHKTDIAAIDACGPDHICRCAFFSGEAIIECDARNLTELPRLPPEATILFLNYNYIQHVDEGSFTNITNLRWIRLDSNKLDELPKHLFWHLMKLETINLSSNKIRRIHEGTFQSLTSLTSLSLMDNLIQRLSEGSFNNLPMLKELDLYANRIAQVGEGVFDGLSSLKSLHLGRNEIQNLNSRTFSDLQQLSLLYLGDNKISSLPEDWLNNGRNLKELRLSENSLQTIRKSDFGTTRSLVYLSISYNNISSLPQDLFINLVLNQILDLSNNRLRTLPEKIFDTNNKTHSLEVLFLHRNEIYHLPKNSFRGLRKLKYLCLFYNKIQLLDAETFAGIGAERIYLFGNVLPYITNASFTYSNITEIYLDCEQVRVIQLNIKIVCVTRQFVPEFKMYLQFDDLMKREGFRCYIRPTEKYADPLTYVCAPCRRGRFGKDGKCVPCFRGGFYQNEVGVAAHHDRELCKRCPVGTFVKNGSGESIMDCAVCPDGTDKQSHAGFRGCFCLQDYARTDRFGPCSFCLEKGVNCSGKDYKSLLPGFYWNWNFPGGNLTEYNKFVENLNTEEFSFDSHTSYLGEIPRAFKCPRRESCSNDHTTAETKCSKGYKGWLCSKCDRKYYPVMSYCLPCPEKDWLFIEVSLSVVIFVVFSVSLFCYYKREKSQSGNARSIIDVIISRGKIALGFYQVVGEFFTSLHEVNWTNSLTFIGNIISVIELNVLRLFIRPQCFHEKLKIDPKIEFIIGLAIPVSSVSLACVSYGLMIVYYKYKTMYGVTLQLFNKKKLRYNFSTVVIIILFATYPPICTIIFQLYPKACEKFCLDLSNNTCYTLLRSDYDIECEDLNVYHILAYIATAGYVVAFPVVLLFLLRKQVQLHSTNTIHTNNFSINEHPEEQVEKLITGSHRGVLYPAWMDFLCENYKPQYWYWEIVELTRKVTQTVLITLLGWEDKLTVLITIGISVLFLTLHARCLPMKNKFEQRLQLFSLVAILVNVLVAAMDVPEEYGGAMSVALIILNVVVIAIIAVEVVFGILLQLMHIRFHTIVMTCWRSFATRFFKGVKRR